MITEAEINKCIKQAEQIIQYYCNVKGVPKQDREDFRAEGFLGLSIALDRARKQGGDRIYAINTYTNSYVRGYLMRYHTIRYEKRKIKSWYEVNQPKSLDDVLLNDPWQLSTDGSEGRTIAKDFVVKALPLLSERQKAVFSLIYLEGWRPVDLAREWGVARCTIGTHLRAGRENIFKSNLTNNKKEGV